MGYVRHRPGTSLVSLDADIRVSKERIVGPFPVNDDALQIVFELHIILLSQHVGLYVLVGAAPSY